MNVLHISNRPKVHSTLIRRHPVVCFVVLTYLITWPFQIASMFLADSAGITFSNEANYQHFVNLLAGDLPADRLLAFGVFNIGQFGPVIAAVVLTAALHGRVGLRDLGARMVRWRLPARWYLIVLALPIALSLATLAITFVSPFPRFWLSHVVRAAGWRIRRAGFIARTIRTALIRLQ